MNDDDTHLVVRNPNLLNEHGQPRIGCWNTEMLTACGRTLPPDQELVDAFADRRMKDFFNHKSKRHVTLRVDLTTCPTCKLMVEKGAVPLKTDEHGRQVTL